MNVLHLSSEFSWRGGENQIRLLLTGLQPHKDVRNFMAFPENSEAGRRLQVLCDGHTASSSKVWDPSAVRRLVQFCESHNIDVIDAHSAGAHRLGLAIKKRLPQVKLVVHRRVLAPIKKSVFTRRKYLSPLVDQYIAISNSIKTALIDYGLSEEKVSVARSAVDPAPYASLDRAQCRQQWRQNLNLPQETIIVGSASALTREKGVDVLIKAVARLKEQELDVHCVIAGEGKQRPELEALVNHLQLRDRISFVGFVKQMPEFLSALDIMAMPSYSEGLGTLVMDATYAGCCVVGSDVGGIPEMIVNEETGLLCGRGDDHGLAEHISKLLTEPEWRQTLADAGLKYIQQNFSLEAMVNGNLSVYQQVLSRKE